MDNLLDVNDNILKYFFVTRPFQVTAKNGSPEGAEAIRCSQPRQNTLLGIQRVHFHVWMLPTVFGISILHVLAPVSEHCLSDNLKSVWRKVLFRRIRRTEH